jgi:hypothetical protein
VAETQAQRIHRKAEAIRAERGGGDPDEGADVVSPIVDEEDRIARSEALSAFRSSDDMRGLPPPAPGDYAGQVEALGSELGQQVDERVQGWLDDAEKTIEEKLEGISTARPQSFVYGAIFGGLMLALGVLLGGRDQKR